MNGSGQAGKAAGLLDNWYETYGAQIKSPLFFEIRMLIAAHAEGDWEKTRAMVGRLRTLVKKGVVPKDDKSWNNVTEKYYRYMHLPPHEIKRQYHAMHGKGQNRI